MDFMELSCQSQKNLMALQIYEYVFCPKINQANLILGKPGQIGNNDV